MAKGDEPRQRDGAREYRAEDRADAEQAKAIEQALDGAAEPRPVDDLPKGEALVDHAIFTAQKQGKALMPEQIEVLTELIVQRCSSMRAAIVARGDLGGFDLEYWGRRTYVLESVLSFLCRLDGDPEAKDYLAKRFRREVIRGEGRKAERQQDRGPVGAESGPRP